MLPKPRVVEGHLIMGGVPCRIPVATIVGLMAPRRSVERIRSDYPDLMAVSERQVDWCTTA